MEETKTRMPTETSAGGCAQQAANLKYAGIGIRSHAFGSNHVLTIATSNTIERLFRLSPELQLPEGTAMGRK